MFKFRKKSHQEVLDNIPNHIGIIMDGNGRWAKKRLQPRVMGHKAGMDALQKVTIEASQLGVKVLTVYAFSTENWSRPQDEVKFIMNLPVEFFNKYVPELDKNNVVVRRLYLQFKRLLKRLKQANSVLKLLMKISLLSI